MDRRSCMALEEAHVLLNLISDDSDESRNDERAFLARAPAYSEAVLFANLLLRALERAHDEAKLNPQLREIRVDPP